jgi:hypothetical protein
MKDFISLKNVKSVYYFEDREFVSLTISYFNNEEPNKYRKRIEVLDVEKKISVIGQYKETYVKIKNALTNKEDFVEVEL